MIVMMTFFKAFRILTKFLCRPKMNFPHFFRRSNFMIFSKYLASHNVLITRDKIK